MSEHESWLDLGAGLGLMAGGARAEKIEASMRIIESAGDTSDIEHQTAMAIVELKAAGEDVRWQAEYWLRMKEEVLKRSNKMSDKKWTQEPWARDPFNGTYSQVIAHGNEVIVYHHRHERQVDKRVVMNFDRIVACVNAMAGIDDPVEFMDDLNKGLQLLADALRMGSLMEAGRIMPRLLEMIEEGKGNKGKL